MTERRPITERMGHAVANMHGGWRKNELPRCFYLNAEDWAEFAATNPGTVEAVFALNGCPPAPITCLAFEGIAVRQCTATKPNRYGVIYSKLYSHRGNGVVVPLA